MRYIDLAEVYDKLEKTSKRLEKTFIISELFKKCSSNDLESVIYLIQGKVFPVYDERKIGMSSKLAIKAIARATGISLDEVERLWKKIGDLGKVALELTSRKKQMTLASKELTVEKVFDNIQKLAEFEGKGTVDKKLNLVVELLNSAKPLEACFIVKTVIEELRIGVGEGTLRDAILWSYFFKEIGLEYNRRENKVEYKNSVKYKELLKEIQNSYDLTVDYMEVALMAKNKNFKKFNFKPGRPFRAMLAILVGSIDEAFESLGKPAQFEYKLDGFRVQIHKTKDGINLFTRNMENVTKQFPDVIEYVKKYVKGKNFTLDSEVVGYSRDGKYLPFQNISQRIKRKYDIEELAKKYPVEVNLFDVLYYDDKDYYNKSLKERRTLLKKIVEERKGKIVLTKALITDDIKKANDFFKEALDAGTEGLVIKNINIGYRAGRHVGDWCKLKRILEPLDLVIIGGEYGAGKRAGVLSSFVLACKDGDKFLECGMMGTGIKEKVEEGVSFKELTKLLKPYIIKEKGKTVKIKPKIVVEVAYEEIQKSPTYSSGFALRFPRLRRLRIKEKNEKDVNTLNDIKRIYEIQRGKGKIRFKN